MITNSEASSPFLRQMSILSEQELETVEVVHVIGVGGIGGPTALLLAKMGIKRMMIYDIDFVEPHNIGSQLFRPQDIGKAKVHAIKDIITSFIPDIDIRLCHGDVVLHKEFGKTKEGKEIFIFALDSNDTRRELYKYLTDVVDPFSSTYIIDPRMGGLGFQVTARHISSCKDYKKFTPTDNQIEDDLCTARAISFNTFGCASMVAAIVRKIIKMHPLPDVRICLENFVFEERNGIVNIPLTQ